MRPSGIGGQAVLEGIMMKNRDKYAVAVRKPDNEIEVKVENYKSKGKKIQRIPFVRGVFNFIDSMVLGIKTLTYSASFFEEEETPKEKVGDKVVNKMFREKAESVIMGLTVIFSVVVSVALFMILPFYMASFICRVTNVTSDTLLSIIEGFIRIGIFVLYIFLISRMSDIKRTFMYHGAEHKCINCVEHGLELNVENVRMSSRQHKRCGTSFLFLVMFISIVFFIFVSVIFPIEERWLKVVIRLLLVPVIAGVSYEMIRLAGKSESRIVRMISAPGMLMQKMTTKEPDDEMIEVAIEAVSAVFDWKDFLNDYDKPIYDTKSKEYMPIDVDNSEQLEILESDETTESEECEKGIAEE